MKNLLTCLVLFVSVLNIHAQSIATEYVYFETDQSDIPSDEALHLDKWLIKFKSIDGGEIKLKGHTDDKGTSAYNLLLSKKRVESVRDYLVNKGISANQIFMDFYGESSPVNTNESESGRQSNRRVEISIIQEEIAGEDFPVKIKEKKAKVPEDESGTKVTYEKLNISEFKKIPQVFCIRNDRDTVIQGKEGTILFFKANSFDQKNIICDCINIELTEFYEPKDIILNNLNTESGDRLLETQGAINVEAFCNDNKLKLKRARKMDIYFSNIDPNQDFELFSGREEAEEIEWKKNTKAYTSDFFKGYAVGRGYDRWFCGYNFFLRRWICNWKVKKREKIWKRQFADFMDDLNSNYASIDFSNFNANMSSRQSVLFTSPNIGYINCDRFINTPKRQLANIYIKDDSTTSMVTSIVFKDIQSVMSGSMDYNGRHWYKRIPKHKSVWVVAIKKKAQKYFLALEERNTNSKEISKLKFKELSKEDLLASLDTIGW